MSDRKLLPGKFVWYEHVSREAAKAQAFYREALGWRIEPLAMGDSSYDAIHAGDTAIGGFAASKHEDQPSHWLAYVSVEDVEAAARAVLENGGKVLEAPFDVPGVGRMARIADRQGAELCLFRSSSGDPPDGPAPDGGWLWNELHTGDPVKALTFYEKVLRFSHRALDMGPAGTYHIVSRGGVDRGGVTGHLEGGAPYWLPYVSVADADATSARAKALGAKIRVDPTDIPGIGRFGVLEDPTGAMLAVMKPLPMEKQF